MITHTIWTTQEDTVFISDRDRNGGRCSVSRADVSRDWKARKNVHSFWLFTDDEGVPRNVCSTNWTSTTVPVSITNKNCVLLCRSNRVCYTNQGSGNPNCFELSKKTQPIVTKLSLTFRSRESSFRTPFVQPQQPFYKNMPNRPRRGKLE